MINWFIVTPVAAVGMCQGASFHIEKQRSGFVSCAKMQAPFTNEYLKLDVGTTETMEDAKALCEASIVKAGVAN